MSRDLVSEQLVEPQTLLIGADADLCFSHRLRR
jgi:hypothetical protein